MKKMYRALYAAFDPYPSPKGSATHIRHFSSALFDQLGGGILYSLGPADEASCTLEGPVRYERFNRPVRNYLERAAAFTTRLREIVSEQPALEVVHFRDIWSGIPLLEDCPHAVKIFEVNGLPSVELPYRYAHLPETTLRKIHQLEQYCLQNADHIVVPSATIRHYLVGRGTEADKITLIPNGADVPPAYVRPADAPEQYLIYFGALQPWQGVDVLLKALHYLQDYQDLRLMICAAHRRHYVKPYRKLAEKLGVAERIIWKFRLPQQALWAYVQHASLSLAPLKEGPRNLEQGCCPLKILESMACGTTVVASDLPVVRELLAEGENARLVKAERPAELARAIRILLDYPEENAKLAGKAREKVAAQYSWTLQKERLQQLYQLLTNNHKRHVQKLKKSLPDAP
jgi:glycosyltransferase involved in cell wall biosynthesis